uniref:Uncharacterized protein n=1 Tax=Arundo donax TaxID=35708 RepID=A0A0A8ZB80_ARUDO
MSVLAQGTPPSARFTVTLACRLGNGATTSLA